ncbi:DNA-binding transcriptional LysR family regulator [Rhizobium sp. BK275]|nr:DNA-binding transcriptional LysR family regulator [Rhizobium sp. BK275]MBB3406167.1 DNA-binding transcriptional LysR family regulator [Rhizobium sp. BK316]
MVDLPNGMTAGNVGFHQPVEAGIDIEDLRDEKIISFSRQNLSHSERCFAEKFEEHDLTDNVTYTCDDTFSLVSVVSAGLRIGFIREWTQDLLNRGSKRSLKAAAPKEDSINSPARS